MVERPLAHRATEVFVVASVLAVALLCYGLKYLPLLSASRPMGDDWDVFLPYLLMGDEWFAANGPFAVPWATPALCGGIPYFPNPRNMYYTPVQWLSFVVSPLAAVHIAVIAGAAAGGLGMYLLLRRSFRQSIEASLLGGLLFLFNGFYSHRMLVGHFEFRAFMLTPLTAFLLLRPGNVRSRAFSGLLAGLLLALMLQSGMVNLAIPMGLAVLWFGVAHGIRDDGLRGFFRSCVIAAVTAVAICAARLASSAAFLTQFPRDYLPLPGMRSIPTLLEHVFQMLFWRATPELSHGWTHVRVRMAPHEWEYSLTPVALAFIVWWLGACAVRRGARLPAAKHGLVAVLVLIALIPIAANFYAPGWNDFLKNLPVLNHMSSLTRWFSFYLPVCCCLAAWGVDAVPTRARAPAAVAGMAIALLFHMTEGPEHIPTSHYDALPIEVAWTQLHETGRVVPIDRVTMATTNGHPIPKINADNSLTEGASQGACYEVLFGYSFQNFPMGFLHEGSSLDATGGVLNVKNPACFLYPAENGCTPGDQFAEGQRAQAERFLQWKPIDFQVSPLQHAADVLNVLALLAVPALLFALAVGRRTTSALFHRE